jgi:hypothetical protein
MRVIKKFFHVLLGRVAEERPVVEVNQPLYYIDVDETCSPLLATRHAQYVEVG